MYDDTEEPEPAQKLLYHATSKLYRFLAGFAGEDPDEVEKAFHENIEEVTTQADPVLIGDAIGQGIGLGLSLAERRRALQRYHDELVHRELAPPAYDTERLVDQESQLVGLRVLVSEPDCQFFTSAVNEGELLVRTPKGGEVEVPLEFEPGPIEVVESGETVSEVIVRPAKESSSNGNDEDVDSIGAEYLDVARNVVLEHPEQALLAEDGDSECTGRLVAKLLERKPSVPSDEAPDFIHNAIRRVGLDTLEKREEGLLENDEPEGDGSGSNGDSCADE